MKSYLFKAIIALVFFFAPAAVQAQPFSILSHAEFDSCEGAFYYEIGINTSNSNLSLVTHFGDGTSSPGQVVQTYGWNSHTYAAPGTYTVKHVLLLSGVPVDSLQFSLSTTLCKNIPVYVYHDANNNCTREASEYSSQISYIEIDSAGYKIDTIQVGYYGYAQLTPGMTYTLKFLNPPTGTSATCPSNATQSITVPTGTTTTSVNFGFQCGSTPPFDLAVNYMLGRYRPTSYSYLLVGVNNNNACSAQNGVLTVNLSPKYNYYMAWPTPTSVSGSTVTFNLNGLGTSFVGIYLTPAGTVNLGDTICASASISPTSGDQNTANNVMGRCDTVVSSWDPNSKEVTPNGNIMPGTKLHYTINFENLGNDTAFNIHVLDTLSQYVDVNSFQMQGASHRAAVSFLDGPQGRTIVKFEFADIKLADSSHPESNKGFVKYSINAKQNTVATLTPLENRAGIYFDTNPVVMTNSTLNTIQPGGVNDVIKHKQLQVYPNPTSGVFTVKAAPETFNTIKVMNNLGQVVVTQSHTSKESTISLAKLPAGMYFILVSGTNGSVAEKIEKR